MIHQIRIRRWRTGRRCPKEGPGERRARLKLHRDGKSIWVAERCGANSCAGSNLPAVLKFDETGKLVKSFGAGMFVFPHGIHVDREGNVWVTDGVPPGAANQPAAAVRATSSSNSATKAKSCLRSARPESPATARTLSINLPMSSLRPTATSSSPTDTAGIQTRGSSNSTRTGSSSRPGERKERPRRFRHAAQPRNGFERPALRRRSE